MTLPHITPYNEANVVADQPWLTVEEHEQMKQIGSDLMRRMQVRMQDDMEPWMLDHLEAMTAEGDQQAIERISPLCHFILTTDFRIVQEPNAIRWGVFLERGMHRIIDRTDICGGREQEPPLLDLSWAGQQKLKQRRRDAPSFKIEATYVSTVFIGTSLDELFETMIFGGWLHSARWKTDKLGDAKRCHWQAVTLAHALKRHIKRHGRSIRKDWIRLDRFWHLAHKRGPKWAIKKVPVMERVIHRLEQVPGKPCIPQPDFLMEMAQMVLPRQRVGT